MATGDLSPITDLEDKHRRALARRNITTLADLADADQRVIYAAMGSIRPRPTLRQIAVWQGEARSTLDESVADATDWHPAASFAVVFAQRRAGGTWERRIEVERTEVEPERNPEVWPGWECSTICGWMLRQLSRDGSPQPGQAAQADRGQVQSADAQGAGQPATIETAPGMAGRAGKRPQLRIDSATLIDAAGEAAMVVNGALTANPPGELTAPIRVVFTVGGAPSGAEVHAVARSRGHDRPGRNVRDPVVVPPSGQAEIDLSPVMDGQLELNLLAWTPNARARLASVRLPAVRIRPGSG
ncbi:MAG TPA: hypothetical protein VEC76_00655 [Streptosporangiaceae bacterium]|nr:hypothetical protein [Streptosporangiaceae bacterium]